MVSITTSAQFVFPIQSARGAAMGGASVALGDFNSATSNPAGFAHQNYTISVAINQNYARKVAKSLCAVVYSSKRNVLAVNYTHYGNIDYNEQQTSLNYALALGKKIDMGVALYYLYSGTSDAYYNSLHLITFSTGLQTHISDNFIIGFRVFNPLGIMSDTEATSVVPILLNVGMSYRFTHELLGTLEVEKNIYYAPNLRFGLEYGWQNKLFVRGGFATQPIICTFGFGVNQRHYVINLSMQMHQILGLTSQMAAYYRF